MGAFSFSFLFLFFFYFSFIFVFLFLLSFFLPSPSPSIFVFVFVFISTRSPQSATLLSPRKILKGAERCANASIAPTARHTHTTLVRYCDCPVGTQATRQWLRASQSVWQRRSFSVCESCLFVRASERANASVCVSVCVCASYRLPIFAFALINLHFTIASLRMGVTEIRLRSKFLLNECHWKDSDCQSF